jgi:hypothetical protein
MGYIFQNSNYNRIILKSSSTKHYLNGKDTQEVDRQFNSPLLLSAVSALFSMGFFALTFSFPLYADHLHYSSGFIGFLGIFVGIPFIVFAYLLLKKTSKQLLAALRLSIILMVPVSLLFLLVSEYLFVLLVVSADVLGALFYVSVELGIGSTDADNLAERYSTAWGIPNLVAPLIAGLILQLSGFVPLFAVTIIFFAATVAFLPIGGIGARNPEIRRKSGISLTIVLPMLFGGLSPGFLFYVIVPYLRVLQTPYLIIGVIGSIPAFFSAVSFIVLSRVKSEEWHKFSIISALLLGVPILVFAFHSVVMIAVLFAFAGIGAAVAFSKILSYISRSSSSSFGVLYYESLFGIGFIAGSISGGYIFEYFGYLSALIIFSPALIYVVAMISIVKSGRGRLLGIS